MYNEITVRYTALWIAMTNAVTCVGGFIRANESITGRLNVVLSKIWCVENHQLTVLWFCCSSRTCSNWDTFAHLSSLETRPIVGRCLWNTLCLRRVKIIGWTDDNTCLSLCCVGKLSSVRRWSILKSDARTGLLTVTMTRYRHLRLTEIIRRADSSFTWHGQNNQHCMAIFDATVPNSGSKCACNVCGMPRARWLLR